MKRTRRTHRRGAGWLAGITAAGLGAILLATSPMAAAAPDSGQVQLTGVLTVTVDHPGGPTVSVATPTGRLSVAGLEDELAAKGLASGDSISVTVTPNPAAAGNAAVVTPFAEEADTFAVPDSVVVTDLAGPASEVSTMAVPAVHDVTLVRAVWPGPGMSDAPSMTALQDATAYADVYWRTTSGDRLDFTVVKTFDSIALTRPPCLDLHAAYDEVKLRTGWVAAPRAHLVVAIPNCTQGVGGDTDGWGSFGADAEAGGFVFLNGAGAFAPGTNGDTGATLAHELGHNLSLHHSNEVICFEETTELINLGPPASSCRSSEDGGVYSVMGSWLPGSQPALGAHQSYLMGYTDGTTLKDVLTPQSVTLVPTSGGTPGFTSARVADSAGNSYYLEYRTKVGLDAYLLDPSLGGHLLEGVVVTKVFADAPGTEFGAGTDIGGQATRVRTRAAYTVDPDPAQNPLLPNPIGGGLYEGDPVLTVGTPVALGDVSVVLTGATPDAATIEVAFPPTRPDPAVPGAPQTVTASPMGNNSALVSWLRPLDGGGAHITSYTASTAEGGATYTCTTVSEMACQIDGLPLGSLYAFTVKATNDLGPSVPSEPSSPLAIGPIPSNSPTPTPTPTPSQSSPSATVKPTASAPATAKPPVTASSTGTASSTVMAGSTVKPTPSVSATTAAVTTPTPASSSSVDDTSGGTTGTSGSTSGGTTDGATYDPFATTTGATTTGATYDPFATTTGATTTGATYDPFSTTSGTTYDPYGTGTYDTSGGTTTEGYVTSAETTGTPTSITTLATTGGQGLRGLVWAGIFSLLIGVALLLLNRPEPQPAFAEQRPADDAGSAP